MKPSQRSLLRLVRNIFEDGVVTSEERRDLTALLRSSGLTVNEVRAVYALFVKQTWGEVLLDDVITEEELAKLSTIVEALRLPHDVTPESVRAVLAGVGKVAS